MNITLVGNVIFISVVFLIILFTIKNNNAIDSDREEMILESLTKIQNNIERKSSYVVSNKLIKMIENDRFDEKTIELLAKDIIKHYGLVCNNIMIEIENATLRKTKYAGQYTCRQGTACIYVNMDMHFSVDTIIAVVAHECMHYYLYARNIHGKTNTAEEIMTDVAAIYCGCGEYFKKGYRYFPKKSTASKVGYLSEKEIDYVMNKCSNR